MSLNRRFLDIDNLPPVYTEEEQIEVFRRYNNGEANLEEDIINHNIRLVISVLLSKKNYNFDSSDVFSEGLMGLLSAVRTYNLNKNIKFSTYAVICIKNKIREYIKKNSEAFQKISMEEDISVKGNGDILAFGEIIKDDTNIENDCISKIISENNKNEIIKILKKLEPQEAKLIYLYFYKQYSLEQIGKTLNISKQAVNVRIKKILLKIKEEILNSNVIDERIEKVKEYK